MRQFIIKYILRPKWVICEHNEAGISIWGCFVGYYKYSDPIYYGRIKTRPVYKRELNEVIHSQF